MSEQSTGELSSFEALSAITPKKQPYAILLGAALLIVALVLVNILAPNEAVEDLQKAEESGAETPAAAQPIGGEDIDDI